MRIVAVGGSDAGISAALRFRDSTPSVDVTVVLADVPELLDLRHSVLHLRRGRRLAQPRAPYAR